jgi:microcystin degradation protein MlrC
MARNANALVSFRTYPHIDGYDRAVQAAALVQEALEGSKTPRCLLSQPPCSKAPITAAPPSPA